MKNQELKLLVDAKINELTKDRKDIVKEYATSTVKSDQTLFARVAMEMQFFMETLEEISSILKR